MTNIVRESMGKIMDRVVGTSVKREMAQQYVNSQAWLRDIMARGGLSQQFINDIYNDEILTPHNEMQECVNMYHSNAFVVTGVEALSDLLLGRDIRFISGDKDTQDFFNKWGKDTDFFRYLPEAIENYVKVGNGYLEPLSGQLSGLPRKWLPVPRANFIWVVREMGEHTDIVDGEPQITEVERLHYWEQVPDYFRNDDAQRVNVSYDRWGTQTYSIRAVNLGYNLLHLKWGVSHVPFYGRSPLASSVSDGKVLREMERAMAVIARYKAIPRKVVTVNPASGSIMGSTNLDKMIQYWNGLSDMENPMFKGVDIDIKDLSYAGQEPQFQVAVDYLKQKVTSALIPSFYIHGNITRYAVALEQKNEFNLICESRRKDVANPINDFIQDFVKQFNSTPDSRRKDSERGLKLSKDIYIEFGDFDYPTRSELVTEATMQWNSGGITLNEYREALGKEPLEDDMGDAFKHELTALEPVSVSPSPRDRSPFDDDEKK